MEVMFSGVVIAECGEVQQVQWVERVQVFKVQEVQGSGPGTTHPLNLMNRLNP